MKLTLSANELVVLVVVLGCIGGDQRYVKMAHALYYSVVNASSELAAAISVCVMQLVTLWTISFKTRPLVADVPVAGTVTYIPEDKVYVLDISYEEAAIVLVPLCYVVRTSGSKYWGIAAAVRDALWQAVPVEVKDLCTRIRGYELARYHDIAFKPDEEKPK